MKKFWFAIGICADGLYVAAAPVWADWKSTKAAAAKYKVDMSDLQYTVKSTFLGTNIMDFPQGAVLTRFVTIPDAAKSWIRSDMTDRIPGFPETMSGAEIMQDLESSFLLPKPAFHFGSSVRAHAWPLFVGLALFASGLSIAEQRRRLFSLAARTRATTRFVPLVTTGIMRMTFTDGSTWSGEELVDRIDNSRADKKEGCRIRTGRQNSD